MYRPGHHQYGYDKYRPDYWHYRHGPRYGYRSYYYGGGYGGGSCWRSVWTPEGWTRRWVCGYERPYRYGSYYREYHGPRYYGHYGPRYGREGGGGHRPVYGRR
jgi:hypothetical protein